jgi:hypothetical protein
VSRANIHRTQFWFLHYFLLHAVFVSHDDIPCTFHSTHCTMPKFSTPPLRTNILRSTNTAHTTRTIIMCVTPHNAKFSTRTHTPTFFRATPKFSARTRTPTYFCAVPQFSACTRTPTFFLVVPNFSAHSHTPTFFCAAPKFSAHTSTPTFFRRVSNFYISQDFTVHHAFLVYPPAHIHFYAHQFFVNSTT